MSLLRQNGTDFTAQFTEYCLTCRGRVRGTDNSFWLANRHRAVRQKRYCAVWNYGVYRVNCAVYNFWYTASRSVAQHIEHSVVDLRS